MDKKIISLLSLGALVCIVSADPFGIGNIPPYGIPIVEADKEGIEKGMEIAKELSLEKAFPFLEKEFAFDNGVGAGLGIGKELELGKSLGIGFGKEVGFEKTTWFPWGLWEKYFGVTKKITFEQALALELYKKYGYYGLWVARELERRFSIAKELGLIGKEIAFQEAITLGLFKGIGLDTIFESSLKAIGVEMKTASKTASRESLEKVFESLLKF